VQHLEKKVFFLELGSLRVCSSGACVRDANKECLLGVCETTEFVREVDHFDPLQQTCPFILPHWTFDSHLHLRIIICQL
jgi:hypothetical protein